MMAIAFRYLKDQSQFIRANRGDVLRLPRFPYSRCPEFRSGDYRVLKRRTWNGAFMAMSTQYGRLALGDGAPVLVMRCVR